MTFIHTGTILINITSANSNNELELFSPRKLLPELSKRYTYFFKCRYDLSIQYVLKNTLNISVVPPINPEDSLYKKHAKWLTATQNSDKNYLSLKSRKSSLTFKKIECFNFGGTWQENLIDSAFINIDDTLTIKMDGKPVASDDYILVTGNWVIEVSEAQRDLSSNLPQNFGVPITSEPTIVRGANLNRARLSLMNTGDSNIWLSFGTEASCIVGECLLLPKYGIWNDEQIVKPIITSSIYARTESELATSTIAGVEVSWI